MGGGARLSKQHGCFGIGRGADAEARGAQTSNGEPTQVGIGHRNQDARCGIDFLVHNYFFCQEWSVDRVGMRCSVRAMERLIRSFRLSLRYRLELSGTQEFFDKIASM